MNIEKLTGLELLKKVMEITEAGSADYGAFAIKSGYLNDEGTADLTALSAAIEEANAEFGGDIIDTVDRDASAFAQYASAIVRKAYYADFPQEQVETLPHPQLEEMAANELAFYYDRLSNTLFGWFCINIIRAVVVSWYGRLGCPDSGTPDERIERYLAVWDKWETAHGGCDENAKPCVEVIDGSAQEGSANYYKFLGRRIAEVLSTMTHNAQHPDDQWQLTEGFYKDYEYIQKQLIEGPDVVTNAAANSVTYLPRFSGRFVDIGEMYVNRWWMGLMEGGLPGSLTSTNAEAPATPHGYKADDRYNLLLLITQDDYEQSIQGSEVDEANWTRVLSQWDGEIYWRYTKGECLVNSETGERMNADEYSDHYPPQGIEYHECTFSPKWADGFDYMPLWEAAVSDGSIDEDDTDVDELSKMIKAGRYFMGDKGGYISMPAS